MSAHPASDRYLADESSTASLHTHGADIAASKARGHLALLPFAMRSGETAAAVHHVREALTQLAIAERHLLARSTAR